MLNTLLYTINRFRCLILLLFFFFILLDVFADKDECVKIRNKEAISLYNEAIQRLQTKKEEQKKIAYSLLKKATEIEPQYAAAYYALAGINYETALNAMSDVGAYRYYKNYLKYAEEYFLKVVEYCSPHDNYRSYYYLGNIYDILKDRARCRKYYRLFAENCETGMPELSDAIESVKRLDRYFELVNDPVPFNPKSLGGVSTKDDEFLPLISPDGELIFFTHKYYSKSKDELVKEQYVEEFTMSRRETSSVVERFGPGERMPAPFNEDKEINQGGVSITIDNNHLYITVCAFEGLYDNNNMQYKNCDIYTTDYVEGGWTPLRRLGNNINGSMTWEGQPSITADGKILYFASFRDGGYGGIDIYRCKKDDNGEWGKAENLGPTINTAGDDKSPFMHSDSQTLYFASDGRYGVGGFDIYYSKLDNDGKWAEVKNIGFPINTPNDDLSFIVSTDGKKAYFASDALNSVGGLDIFSFDLYKEARPEKVLFLKGELKDDEGEVLQDAKVEMKSVKTSRVTEGMVDKVTGKYAIAVPVEDNEDFIMTVRKPDYAFTSLYIKPDEEKFEKPVKADFEVKPIEVGKVVKINDIYFAFNSSDLDKASLVVLDNFMEFLEENPKVRFAIQGHTDNVGNDDFNLTLSHTRAKSVYDYLLLMGIDAVRMTYQGFGETKPVATNDTDAGRALNRRTEFVILEK